MSKVHGTNLEVCAYLHLGIYEHFEAHSNSRKATLWVYKTQGKRNNNRKVETLQNNRTYNSNIIMLRNKRLFRAHFKIRYKHSFRRLHRYGMKMFS